MAASLPGARNGELPAETDRFVGRMDELAAVAALLEESRGPVTLTGPGGVGKSRLALRAARCARASYPGGVRLVELSALRDPALLPDTVAEVVEQTDLAALLILDTCEHLREACVRMVSELCTANPRLTVLATSRQPLGAPGEQVLVVDPLPPGDAVELFMARAAPDLVRTEAGRSLAAEICSRQDGIPLAIELAAAQLRSVPPVTPPPDRGDRPGRHRTLRTTIGWSHELCTPLERLLWARLSVFAGGWDTESAEFVCHGGPLQGDGVLQLLTALTEKSIVRRESPEPGARYRMLDAVREFGAQWLAELGEQDAVRRSHHDYFRWLARRGDAEWLGPRQRSWSERMGADHANVRIALEHGLAMEGGRSALDMAGSLWFFWYACGHAQEGRRYLERALAGGNDPSPERSLAAWAHALVTLTQDDLDAAEEAGAAFADRLLPLAGASLAVRGEAARSLVPLGGGGGAEFFRLLTLAVRAYLLAGQNAFARAADAADQLRTECEKRGELWMRAWGDYFRGLAELGLGNPAPTVLLARRAVAAKWRLHDVLGTAAAIDLLAAAAARSAEEACAARLLGASSQFWAAAGLPQLGAPETSAFRRACAARLSAVLGTARYASEYAAGRALTPEAAVALAEHG
ncbi:ATP-binding protein [Streptomyces beijiangensis]|uniref:Regulator n=1 Tax=Streptomyces beijiangensis TaxID=163361 RepID=A0A939JE96_9ACTN|nr:regulator [Streptomyces beijiangensis]MBO0512851.1 regulator [Streptomyces beijiangensis]